jgi:trehalose synthase
VSRPTLGEYAAVAGSEVVAQLRALARPLAGKRVVHVNSTRTGGGVAEILTWLVDLKRELGIDASWTVLEGTKEFFVTTKSFHNALQGDAVNIPRRQLDAYMEVNRENARRLGPALEDADFVFIHDPQPAALLGFCPNRKGKWVWRCHIDLARPFRRVWTFLRDQVRGYDASIFSLATFARPLPHAQYLIPPSIDPLSEKNAEMTDAEVAACAAGLGLDPERPVVLQVSRFDRFKDPVGVIRAARMVRAHPPVQLVLAGGAADDDPEGEAVLADVRDEAADDPDIHILLLPPDAHRTINALQRRADIVVQKSLREGFGLTVTEALWKGRPVIGGDVGGITLQVAHGHTGFLVNSPEGAALRIRYLLSRPELRGEMGRKGHQFVRDHFLLTRHLREYLALLVALHLGNHDSVRLD